MARMNADQLREKSERIRKTLSEKKGSLKTHQARELRKRVKRAQRARRSLLATEKRDAERMAAKSAAKAGD